MTQRGPEETKLRATLAGMKLNGFHATWGPNAHLLTREQRAAALNRVLEQVATGVGEPLDFADSQREVI